MAGPESADNTIDDRFARVAGSLAFGLTIPHIVGLFGPLTPADPRFALGVVWFVVLASAVWEGNRWLLFRQRERWDWFTTPIAKLVFLVVGCVFYTAPLTAGALWVWYAAVVPGPTDVDAIAMCVLMNVICVLVVTHVYETVFLVKARYADRLLLSELERSRAEGELAALRSQIDPHFLFNSLATLKWLVDTDPTAASVFTARLAQVYRYLLSTRDDPLVQLSDELAFFDDCLHLLSVRFGPAIRVERSGAPGDFDAYLIPPASLQLLLENAVKHTVFSERDPLTIELEMNPDGPDIAVTNPIRPREADGEGVGLDNLAERVRLQMSRELAIDRSDGRFRVVVPLLRVA